MYPWHAKTGKPSICEYVDPTVKNPAYNTSGTSYGVVMQPSVSWKHELEDDVITNCVTLPIKFRSNTFRVTVSVETHGQEF